MSEDKVKVEVPVGDVCGMITVTVDVDVQISRLKDLLTGAFEGGSNYWYMDLDSEVPPEERPQHWHIDLPFVEGGPGVTLRDCEALDDEDSGILVLNREKCLQGIQTLADVNPHQFSLFIDESDDAITSDCYLQCCLFGNVIYG